MASRRYPTAELYEERERDFYRNGRSERTYDELDVELRRGGDPRRSAPDFFRDDYNRNQPAGPLVMRPREDDFSRGPRHARTFDDDARSARSSRPGASSVREVERDDITIRRSEGTGERRRPREVNTEETDIVIRHRDQSRPRHAEFREVERDDIVFRRGDGPPTGGHGRHVDERDDVRFRRRGSDEEIDYRHSETKRNGRAVSTERETIRFQERDGKFEFRENRRDFSRDGRSTSKERSSITIRGRERSLPPPSRGRGELVAREREEFVVRRPRDFSPPEKPREIIKDEIIIRRKEERIPTPEPSPSPPPLPAPPALEPEFRPPIIQEIITHHRHIDHGVVRARSPTPPPLPSPPSPPPARTNEYFEIEIKHQENTRGRKETEELDIDININRDRSRGDDLGVKSRRRDMWTEITKDLVIREAIDSMGYSCEETDDFFYVMEYLRYEDVLQLVEISDGMRAKRKTRVREIEIERKEYRDSRPQSGGYDYYEHDVSYDSRRGSRYR